MPILHPVLTCGLGVLSAPHPDLAERYAEVERRIDHRFPTDFTMADVIAEARDTGQFALIPLADIA